MDRATAGRIGGTVAWERSRERKLEASRKGGEKHPRSHMLRLNALRWDKYRREKGQQ